MDIAQWIKEARKKSGLSQEALGSALGLTKGNVSAWENGRHRPSLEQVAKLSKLTGFPLPLDLGANGAIAIEESSSSTSHTMPKDVRLLPLISFAQAANWLQMASGFQSTDAEDWLACPFKHGRRAYVLKIAGKSMYNPGGDKSYNEGEYIAVDPDVEARHGSSVIVHTENENTAVFRRLLIEPDGTRLLEALNPSWPNRIHAIGSNSTICGVCIGKWTSE